VAIGFEFGAAFICSCVQWNARWRAASTFTETLSREITSCVGISNVHIEAGHLLDEGDHEYETRVFDTLKFAQGEDHRALVLA
jgi:hypothetical protein